MRKRWRMMRMRIMMAGFLMPYICRYLRLWLVQAWLVCERQRFLAPNLSETTHRNTCQQAPRGQRSEVAELQYLLPSVRPIRTAVLDLSDQWFRTRWWASIPYTCINIFTEYNRSSEMTWVTFMTTRWLLTISIVIVIVKSPRSHQMYLQR